MGNRIIRYLKIFEVKVIPGIAICLFAFSVTWMLVEALSRQIFERSYAVSEELIVFSLLWAVFLILPQSGRSGFHIYVDLFISKTQRKIRRVIEAVNALLSIIYCGILFFSAYEFIRHLYRMEIISESPLQLPMWAVCLAIPVGALMLALFYLEKGVSSFRNRGN